MFNCGPDIADPSRATACFVKELTIIGVRFIRTIVKGRLGLAVDVSVTDKKTSESRCLLPLNP